MRVQLKPRPALLRRRMNAEGASNLGEEVGVHSQRGDTRQPWPSVLPKVLQSSQIQGTAGQGHSGSIVSEAVPASALSDT